MTATIKRTRTWVESLKKYMGRSGHFSTPPYRAPRSKKQNLHILCPVMITNKSFSRAPSQNVDLDKKNFSPPREVGLEGVFSAFPLKVPSNYNHFNTYSL